MDITKFENVGELSVDENLPFAEAYTDLIDGIPFTFSFTQNLRQYVGSVTLNLVSERLLLSISNDEDEEIQTNTTIAEYPQNLLTAKNFGSSAVLYFADNTFYFAERE